MNCGTISTEDGNNQERSREVYAMSSASCNAEQFWDRPRKLERRSDGGDDTRADTPVAKFLKPTSGKTFDPSEPHQRENIRPIRTPPAGEYSTLLNSTSRRAFYPSEPQQRENIRPPTYDLTCNRPIHDESTVESSGSQAHNLPLGHRSLTIATE
ncbi:hypothetical protein AVEN_82746-1 [Araneus ventricosus]|uniref:Uncharacterized protein n=1 Tax=Araneus ventricosus TaxID=182803 RepID=A0A4Y2EA37_ARAVE|nr:hypothetical protein AVEN_82746-1 [Araneus ventricosus]